MKRAPLLVALVASVCALPRLSAQTTWTVDPTGAGGALTSIQAAVDAASSGDTILVRAGRYAESVVVDFGLRVLADPGVILDGDGSGPALQVVDVAAGETVTWFGMRIDGPDAKVLLRECVGAVHLELFEFTKSSATDRLTVDRCDHVTIADSEVYGSPAMRLQGGRIVLTECTAAVPLGTTAREAALIHTCTTTIVGGHFVGGSALGQVAPGIVVVNDSLTLTGNVRVEAGDPSPLTRRGSALRSTQADVIIDPSVTFESQGGAPELQGGGFTWRVVPYVASTPFTPGSFWALDVYAPVGTPFALFASTTTPPVPTSFGDLWLDPSVGILAAATAIPPPFARYQVRYAAAALPPGLPIVAQAFTLLGSTVEATNPAIRIVR